MQKEPLILTLRLDAKSQQFFDVQRKQHFPTERNFIDAHLTLFHHLPPDPRTLSYLSALSFSSFQLNATGLMKLGGGVAYRVESGELQHLHQQLKIHFQPVLTPQDLQPFRSHITIQNKVTHQAASLVYAQLSLTFQPFTVVATGLQLWAYLGGPWRLEQTFGFTGQHS